MQYYSRPQGGKTDGVGNKEKAVDNPGTGWGLHAKRRAEGVLALTWQEAAVGTGADGLEGSVEQVLTGPEGVVRD